MSAFKNILSIIICSTIFSFLYASGIYKKSTCYTGGLEYCTEIFQVDSRLHNKKPMCFFYKIKFINYGENKPYDPRERFELLWSRNLVDDYAPSQALVSQNGFLVTFGNFRIIDKRHSLVIYDKKGKVICDYSLYQLMPRELLFGKGFHSYSESNWYNDALYYFINSDDNYDRFNPTHLYIVLKSEKVLAVNLITGKTNYGDIIDFSDLKKLLYNERFDGKNNYSGFREFMENRHSPGRAFIGENSIEFSSITELLDCKNNRK